MSKRTLQLIIIGLFIMYGVYTAMHLHHVPATPAGGSTAASSGSAVFGTRSKTSGCTVRGALPDSQCTPGVALNGVTTAQICRSGYASSVRNVPTSVKDAVYREYDISSHAPGEYEVDHLVSLELGGSNDIANLWPEAADPTPGFHEKDVVENYLHDQVCAGKMSLSQAQQTIAGNWLAVYKTLQP